MWGYEQIRSKHGFNFSVLLGIESRLWMKSSVHDGTGTAKYGHSQLVIGFNFLVSALFVNKPLLKKTLRKSIFSIKVYNCTTGASSHCG